ncbi:MAG TPA: hypothetical protein VFA86_06725 [Gammaproteobacteria bacterium]|nr:hypothetical protein [Gammaproteobacteria bacterium]
MSMKFTTLAAVALVSTGLLFGWQQPAAAQTRGSGALAQNDQGDDGGMQQDNGTADQPMQPDDNGTQQMQQDQSGEDQPMQDDNGGTMDDAPGDDSSGDDSGY